MVEQNNKDLIEKVLKKDPEDIEFEPIPEEKDSPLSQPVVQKNATANETNTGVDGQNNVNGKQSDQSQTQGKEKQQEKVKETLDAPEQQISDNPEEERQEQPAKEEEFTVPLSQATMMANSIMGMVNNTILEVGAGYFVTISKHQDFYDFDEVIQIIDEQNVKNIKRIKLDEEDKAMLRPLLIAVIRKKAKVLSPESQLLGVAISIIVKKAKAVMEMRAENDMLVERIRDVIRKEVNGADSHQESEKEDQDKDHKETLKEVEVVYEQGPDQSKVNNTGLPSNVLETTD